MKTVALVRSPGSYYDWSNLPAIGLACLSAYLEQNGFCAPIVDSFFLKESEEQCLDSIGRQKPDLVGISAMTHDIESAALLAGRIREKYGIPVVVGGCHITALPEQTLSEFPAFDFGVLGEGEKTLLELMQLLAADSQDFSRVQGLVYRKDGNPVRNPERSRLTDAELDALPYPNVKVYYKGASRRKLPYIMFGTRGCPYDCAFCRQTVGKKVSRRSAKGLCDEMEFAIAHYGISFIYFNDDLLLFNHPSTFAWLEEVIRRGLQKKVGWSGHIRVNHVTPELVALAKRAGCCHLSLGVESGSDEILKVIHKNITVAQVREAVAVLKLHKIDSGAYFILGHPDETRETALQTQRLAVSLNTTRIAIGLMVPYPGTRIYEMAKQGLGGYRLAASKWSDYAKYFHRPLDFEKVKYEELLAIQKKTLFLFYFKNRRFIDLAQYLFLFRRALLYFIIKAVKRRLILFA